MAITINGSANTIGGVAVGGLPNGIVDADTLATDAVSSAKIAANAVSSAKIAANAVTGAKLASGVGGKVLQVVDSSTTTETGITSQTFTDSGLSATITPSSASNKILILVNQHYTIYRHDDDNNGGIVLLRGSTVIGDYLKNSSGHLWGVGGDWQASGAERVEMRLRWNFSYLDSPNTTSATTYKTQGATYSTNDNEEIKFQRNSSGTHAGSYIQLLEIAA